MISTIILFCFIPFTINAENDVIEKGNIMFNIGTLLDVGFYFGGNYNGAYEETNITIGSGPVNLNVKYFVIDGLSLGGSAYFYSNKVKAISVPSTKIMFGPIVSYYHAISDNILMHGSGYIYYVKVNPYYTTVETSQFSFGIGAGATYLVTSNLGFFGEVSYLLVTDAIYTGGIITDSGYHVLDFSIGLSVFIDITPSG
jgi:hypothetical protein